MYYSDFIDFTNEELEFLSGIPISRQSEEGNPYASLRLIPYDCINGLEQEFLENQGIPMTSSISEPNTITLLILGCLGFHFRRSKLRKAFFKPF